MSWDSECGLPEDGNEDSFGGGRGSGRNDVTGVFAAMNGGGQPTKVIAEGDVLPEGKVMRLFTPMPELRQHDAGDDFVIRAWFDTTGDCRSDSEGIILASAIPFEHPMIPTLGPWGLWLLIGILGIFGGARLLPRRN